MPATYKKIASVTVTGSATSSVGFTSIPTTYDDIMILFSGRLSTDPFGETWIWCELGFNTDGAHINNTGRILQGNGSAVSSSSNYTYFYIPTSSATASTFGNTQIYIPNYAGSNQKSFSIDSVMETNATASLVHLAAGLWTGTAAINAFTIYPRSGSFAINTSATLYGIKKA